MRNCFWDRGRACQLLVNFCPCPSRQSQESFRKLTRTSFPLFSKVANMKNTKLKSKIKCEYALLPIFFITRENVFPLDSPSLYKCRVRLALLIKRLLWRLDSPRGYCISRREDRSEQGLMNLKRKLYRVIMSCILSVPSSSL